MMFKNLQSDWLLKTIFLSEKGWNDETISEVRACYKDDFPKLFPNLNFVTLPW